MAITLEMLLTLCGTCPRIWLSPSVYIHIRARHRDAIDIEPSIEKNKKASSPTATEPCSELTGAFQRDMPA